MTVPLVLSGIFFAWHSTRQVQPIQETPPASQAAGRSGSLTVDAPDEDAPSPPTTQANQTKAQAAHSRNDTNDAKAGWLAHAVAIGKSEALISKDLLRETRLLKANFKYPLIRVERTVQRDATTGQDTLRREEIMVASHLLVKPEASVSKTAFASAVKRAGGTNVRPLPGSDYRIVEFAATDVDALPRMLKELSSLPGVIKHAEPDYIVHAMTIPDDTRFSEQWGLNNTGQTGGTPGADIRATSAWTTTTGSSSVTVAVVDSGIDYTHPDLAANIWSNVGEIAGNGVDDDNNGLIDDTRGWNFVSANNTPQDDRSHGTHIAGTIGAVGNNGSGVSGVCWQVKLMPLKFLDSTGSGTTSDAIAAINYARVKQANIINNSWGGSSFSQALKDAVDAAGTDGILSVCAAGNTDDFGTGYDRDVTPGYPANYASASILSIASTDRNDNLSGFSSYGATTVHLAAPGSEILSTVPGASYGTKNGTSMAAPHVSGIAALLRAYKPALAAPDLKLILQASVDHAPSLEGRVITEGRANAASAIQRANDIATLPATGLKTVGNQGGPFAPTSVTYTLKNFHGTSVNWTAALTGAPWATLSAPSSGTLAAGASVTLTVTVDTALANAAPPGLQQGTLTIHNSTTGVDITRAVILDVRIPYIYSFDLNTDPGWSREEAWQYGIPMGKGGESNGNPDPTAGHTGTSVFGVNLNGDYPTQVNGMHSLVAGPFDLRGYSQTKLEFWRWLNSPGNSGYVSHWIQVRNEDSQDWTLLWSNYTSTNDNAWTEQVLNLDSIGDGHSAVYIRWNYQVTQAGAAPASGWNLDDIKITGRPQKRIFLNGVASASENAGTAALTLHVEPPSPTPLIVTLTSSVATAATLPTSVTVPANTSSISVSATPVDDLLLDGTQTTVLTATVTGYTSIPWNLDVTDNESATLTLDLPANAVEGATDVQGTVTMSQAAGSNVKVSLKSNMSNVAGVPAFVIIPTGQTSATFPITLPQNSLLEGAKTVQITAFVAGWTGASANLAVADDESPVIALSFPVSVAPYNLAEGVSSSGYVATVSFSGPRLVDTVVTLTPDDTTAFTLPASVTIPAGRLSATITPVTVIDDALQDGVQTVVVTASAAGLTNGTASVTVADNEIASLAFDYIGSPQTPGTPVYFTLRALDVNGAAAAGFNGVANIIGLLDGSPDGSSTQVGINNSVGTGSLNSTLANALRATLGSVIGTSNTFTREAGATAFLLAANSIAYDGTTDRLYASTSDGTIVPIWPNGINSDAPITVSTGVVGQIEALNGVLYAAVEGGTKIVKVNLVTRAVGTPFALGSSFGSNWTAVDFAILPNDSATIGVILNNVNSGDPKVAVYTDGVRRSTVIAYNPFSSSGPNFQEVTNAGASNRFYAVGTSSSGDVLHLLDVSSSGVAVARSYTMPGTLTNLRGSGALLIADGGYVIEGETGNVRGRIGVTNGAPSGAFVVDEMTGRATLLARRTSFYLDPWDVRVFDLASFADLGGTQISSEPLSVPFTYPTIYAPAVRVGAHSIAYRGGSTVNIVPTPLILPAATPQPDLAVQQINAPANAPVGQPVSFNMLVRNMGTAPAANVVLKSTCSNAAPFLNASTTQGTLTQQGATVSAQLGTLAPGDAATVCVVLVARAGGNTNSMSVTTSTPEPHTLNNLSSLTNTPPVFAPTYPRINLTTTDLASSKVTQRIYAPLGLGNGLFSGTLAVLDLTAPAVRAFVPVGSGPGPVALAENETDLLVGREDGMVLPVNVGTFTAGTAFSPGTAADGRRLFVKDMVGRTGQAGQFLISRRDTLGAAAGVALFQSGVQVGAATPNATVIEWLAAGGDSATAYGLGGSFSDVSRLSVDGSGVSVATSRTSVSLGRRIGFAGGRVIGANGRMLDPATLADLGYLVDPTVYPYALPLMFASDPERERIYMEGDSGNAPFRAFSSLTFQKTAETSGNSLYGTPDRMVRWGDHGLALCMSTSGLTWMDDATLVPDPPLHVNPPAFVMENAGTLSNAGTLQLTAPAPSEVTVTLASSNPALIQVPSPVTIPAGQTNVSFSITVIDDNLLNGARAVTITPGAATGYVSLPGTFVVRDDESSGLALALPASVNEGAGALDGQGAVTLTNGPAAADITVQLSSDDPSELTVPASVIIAAGQSSASFTLTAPDDPYLDGTRIATVTAGVDGWTPATRSVNVLDDEVPTLSWSLGDTTVSEGQFSIAASVFLPGKVETATVVNLGSSDTTELTVPATVTIPANGSSVSFSVNPVNDTAQDGRQTVTLTASAPGLTTATANVVMTDDEPASLVWNTVPNITAGDIINVSLGLRSIDGDPVPAPYGTLTTITTLRGGQPIAETSVAWNNYANSTVFAGSLRLTSAGTDTALSATYSGFTGTSNAFTVLAGPMNAFVWNAIPGSPPVNIPFSVTVRAADGYGNLLTSFNGTASLSAAQDAKEKVVGTGTAAGSYGLDTGTDHARIIAPFTAAEIGHAGRLHGLALEIKAPPGRAFDNFTMRLKHSGSGSFNGLWDAAGWTTVRTGALDLTQSRGWVEIPFTTPFDYDGTSLLLVDFFFSNTGAPVVGGEYFVDSSNYGAVGNAVNAASGYGPPANWTGYTPSQYATPRPNVRFAFGTALTVTPAATGNFVNGVWAGDVTFTQSAPDVFLTATNGIAVGNSNTFDVGVIPPAAPVMTAEPGYTGSTTNMVSWGAVSGATAYYVEAATDNAFSAPIANSGWITATSYAFTGLASGTHYYYRVKAQKNSLDGPWSNTVDSTQDATGPVIYLGNTDDGVKTAFITNANSWIIGNGKVLDSGFGVASLQILIGFNTYNWSFSPNGNWNVKLDLPGPGTYAIGFRATDNGGNVTLRNVTITQTTATLSDVASLSNLVPGTGSLTPAFNSSTLAYSMSVPATTDFVSLTPTVTQGAAAAWINGTPVPSGNTSQDIPLAAGDNVINVVVTAENGVATQTYAVTVTRPSPVATLAATDLSTSGATLRGAVTANAINSAIGFDYGLSNNYGGSVPGSPAAVNGSGSVPIAAVVTGLAPGTTYHYRITRTNSYGTIRGEDMTFTTVGIPVLSVEQPAGTALVSGASSVDFGNVVPGAGQTKDFTVKNTGSADLTGLEVAFTGTDKTEFATGALSSTTLAPGASMIVNVTFTPGAGGPRAATMEIAHDADANPFTVALTGSGLVPGAGKLAIGGALFPVNEEAGTVTIPVTRTGGNEGTVSVKLSTTNGTATAGSDYAAVTNQVLTFAPGDTTTKNVPITILNPPNTSEPNESFTVMLSGPTGGATLATQKTATVVIRDSVDTTPPGTPTVTAPAVNAKLNVNPGGTVAVTGSATDNQLVGAVEASVDNGNTFAPATIALTGAGAAFGKTATYSVHVIPPTGGANSVQVRTRDRQGNISAVASRSFNVLRPLGVNIAGSGSVTAGFAPTSFREVGKSCTIIATPTPAAAPGFAFDGWSVSGGPTLVDIGVTATALELPKLTFVFREGLVLTANFIPNPFSAAVTGSFNGLILPSPSLPAPGGSARSNETVGKVTATVLSTGAFSGTLFIDGMSLGFAGVFDNTGTGRFGTNRATTFTVVRTTKPSYLLALYLDVAPAGTNKMTGTLTQMMRNDIKSVSTLDTDRAFYNGTTVKVPSNLAGTSSKAYTFILPSKGLAFQPAGFTLADYPQGDGYATGSVNINGTVSVVGKLADGTILSTSCPLSRNNTWPLFQPLYPVGGATKGCIAGQITLTDGPANTVDMTGTDLLWFRPFQLVQWYPFGWPEGIKVDLMGARYVVPPATPPTSVFPGPGPSNPLTQPANSTNGNATATFSDGVLSGPITRNVSISPTNVATRPTSNTDTSFTMLITSSNGLISGMFTHTDGTKPAYQGVIIQKGTNRGAYGYFMTKQPAIIDYKGESGGVTLLAKP